MWRLTIENIAGIRSGSATIEPGVNAVEASNWRGKSSLIAAVETVLGTATPLTEGADSGRVELETDDGTVVTELVRDDDGVRRDGDVLLSDEHDRVCAALFAALGESNEIRRAVREGDDLEALLTRPLDLENVETRIATLRSEREAVERERARADAAASDLPAAEEHVARLEAELADLREERAALDEPEPDEDGDLAERREALSEKRAARERTAATVERLSEQIERLETELDGARNDLDGLDVPDAASVEADLEAAREELAAVEADVDLLQTVYNANRRVLEEERVDLLTEVERGIVDDAIDCWVCGGTAERSAFEARLDAIGERIADRRERSSDLREAVEELEAEHRAIGDRRRERRDLEDEVSRIEARLADSRGDLETAEERLDRLTDEVASLDAEVEVADERLTDIESEIKYAEASLEDARERVAELESTADQLSAIEAQREEITDEIEALRSRKERVKRETREAFDAAIDAVLETFEPGFEAARLTASYELVVARDGREVGLDALSEGEVELLGLVAALAGYEAFEVGERVPVLLLDRLGGLAGENLHRLVDYVADRSTYLVTTAYPEQGGYDWHAISPTDWDVVSDDGLAA